MKTDIQIASAGQKFIESILALRPKIAVFDCDGTLWSGDSGADFFYWEIKRNMIPAKVAQWAIARYDEYKAGNVGEEAMCGEMVTINAGIPMANLEKAAEEFFASVVAPRVFPEMLQLTRELHAAGRQHNQAISQHAGHAGAEADPRQPLPRKDDHPQREQQSPELQRAGDDVEQ